MASKILRYFRKYKKRGLVENPLPPVMNEPGDIQHFEHDFGNQYHYFHKDIDPEFPEPLTKELDTSVYCDSDHANDLVTGRSVTGVTLPAKKHKWETIMDLKDSAQEL